MPRRVGLSEGSRTSALQAEVHEAVRTLDVPDEALEAATALSSALAKAEDETTEDFDGRAADIEANREDVTGVSQEIAGIDGRMATVTGESNLVKRMPGTTLATVVTVLFRVSSHRYGLRWTTSGEPRTVASGRPPPPCRA